MKKLFAFIGLSIILLSFSPAISLAHVPPIFPSGYWGGPDTGPGPNAGNSGIVSCTAPIIVTPGTGVPETPGYIPPKPVPSANPCVSFCDIIHTSLHVIAFGESITLFAAAPILFAWGGILILISSGNPGKISEGKKVLTGTLIGILIILFAYLIVKTLIDTLGVNASIPLNLDCIVR